MAIGLGLVVLVIAAAISIMTSPNYTAAGKCLWILVLIALPILGALGWFVWGRTASLTPQARVAPPPMSGSARQPWP